MEAIEKHEDSLMGFYFSCPHCQGKYVSAECVREHSSNCHMQSSFMIPKIESYSSLNPQAVALNLDSEGFQIRHEIIKTEPEDDCREDDLTGWQDEIEDSTLIDPEEIIQNGPNHRQAELQKTQRKPEILRDSVESPHSACKEDRARCCPRPFPSPSSVQNHEESHKLEPNYSCGTCGKHFALGVNLIHHVKMHQQRSPAFQCCFPGCVMAYKSTVARWYHHKTHPRGRWNEREWRPRILKKNQPSKIAPTATIIPDSEALLLDNQEVIQSYQVMDRSIGESSMTDQNELKQHETAENAPSVLVLLSHNQGTNNYPMGQPFIARKFLVLKRTVPRKFVPVEIVPNIRAAPQPFQCPQNIQLNKSPNFDQNIRRESKTEGISPVETSLLTCGACNDSFEKLDALQFHMLTTHAGSDESQTQELEEIGSRVDNSFRSVRSTGGGEQLPEGSQAGQLKVMRKPIDKSFGSIALSKGPVPRYPIVKIEDMKYFCCGFPGCDAIFSNRHKRYQHHNKFHNGAYRSMLKNLADRQLCEKKAHETSSTQLKENSNEEQKQADVDSRSLPDFPFVQVKHKKYFWCDFPGCGIVVTNLEARYLHQKKHQMSSEQTTVAPGSARPDFPKERKQFKVEYAGVIEKNETEILGEASPPNQPQMSERPIQVEGNLAQAPVKVLAAAQDRDFDEQNQSSDTMRFRVSPDSLTQAIPLWNKDYTAENSFQTYGSLGNEPLTEASTCKLNPACFSICNLTVKEEKDKVVEHRPSAKVRQPQGNRRQLYPTIQVGSKTLFCCGFPGCKGLFKDRSVRYAHHKRHRLGFKNVKSKFKLTEGGMVWNSSDGCYLTE